MKIKTSELTDIYLDWAVAKCEIVDPVPEFDYFFRKNHDQLDHHYSSDWAQGGVLIEGEGIATSPEYQDTAFSTFRISGWKASVWHNNMLLYAFGPTPLIAAMRTYVASKLGDEVDIPEELLK